MKPPARKLDPFVTCFVPTCKNMVSACPNIHYFHVPRATRLEWCAAVNRSNVPNGSAYICEDHLNLEQDLLNYETWIESKVTRPRLKPQVPQNLRNVNSYPTLPSTSVADVDPFLNIQEKGVRCMPECSNIQVALIFGILGACRQHELYSLLLKHVQVFKSMILVKIYNAKSKTYRSFTVTGPHYELCKRYIELRPKSCKIPTFFLNYRSGRCTESKLGKNKFGTLCKTMASFLRLPNPELYTSQCFRRTSVTLSVNNDGDIKATKRQYGWQSVAKYSMMPHDDAGNGDENINDVAKTIGESDIELSEEETNSDKSDTTDPIEIPKTKKLLTAKRISDKKIDTGPNKKPRQDIDDFIIDYDNIDKFGEQIAFLLKRIPRQLCRELQDSIVTLVKTATDKHESKTKVDATPSTSSCTKVNSIISQNVLTRTLVTKTNLNEDITIKEEFNDDSTVDAATQVMQLEQQPGTSTIETFPKPMTIPFELVGSFDCVKQEVLDPGDSSDITVQEQNKDGTTLVKKFSEPNDTLVKIELEENDLNSELKKRMDSND